MKASAHVLRRRCCLTAFVCFMVLGVAVLAIEAKNSQFSSPDSSTSYLAQAIKMKQCWADAGHVPPCVARASDPQITIEPESRIVVTPIVRPLSCPPRGFRQLRAPPAAV